MTSQPLRPSPGGRGQEAALSWLRNYGMRSALSDSHPSRTSTALCATRPAIQGRGDERYRAAPPHGFAGSRAAASLISAVNGHAPAVTLPEDLSGGPPEAFMVATALHCRQAFCCLTAQLNNGAPGSVGELLAPQCPACQPGSV